MMAAVAQRRPARITAALAALLLASAFAVADAETAQAEETGHSLSGAVHLPAGVSPNVVGGMQVVAFDGLGGVYWTAPSVVDGSYTFAELPAGSYTVQFQTGEYYEPPLGYNTPTPVSCGWYNAQPDWGTPTPVVLTASDATGIDFTCTKLLSISGIVSLGTDTSSNWLGGVTVTASGPYALKSAAVNPATGAYTISGLVAGNYTVSFAAAPFHDGTANVYPNLLPEYYDNAADYMDATPVVVTTANVPNIDATLARGYSISGHITMPTDTPSSWREGVAVSAWSAGGILNTGYISESGDYSIYGLSAGNYTVEFAVDDYYYDESTGQYVELGIPSEFYDNAAYVADATPVVVSTTNVININAELEIGNRFDDPPIPVITGGPGVGSVLGVSPGSWNPGPSSLVYQWLRNGTPITGATGGNYTITAADRGTNITVMATGSLDGYASVSVTSLPLAVPPDPFVTARVPTISGSLTAGSTLTTKAGTWSPTPTLTYRWYRNGAAIANATHSTYKLTTTDRGTNVTVKVTGSRTYYATTTKTSAVKYVPKVFSKAATPTITGTAKSGYTLTAHRGTWSPTPTYSYQWYRSGVKIAGATKYTYRLTAYDKGKAIQVKVTGKRTGYTTVTKSSASRTIAR